MAKPETTRDLEALQQWYQRLMDRQRTLQAEINQYKADEAYHLITSQTDLDTHFADLRKQMQQQINHLRQQDQPS